MGVKIKLSIVPKTLLFFLQFIVGFFSFLLLLCCESATASFRAALVPIHSTFGITTFVMAVATSCTGLIEKAFFTLRYVRIKKKITNNNRKREQSRLNAGAAEKVSILHCSYCCTYAQCLKMTKKSHYNFFKKLNIHEIIFPLWIIFKK